MCVFQRLYANIVHYSVNGKMHVISTHEQACTDVTDDDTCVCVALYQCKKMSAHAHTYI